MIAATRRWLRRNRTNLAVGAGVLGATYFAGQYVLSKITEARQRMADERIARENLRRRFEQNQEDCTYTVLAILPTATDNITQAVPVEQTLEELQQQKAERLARSVGASEIASSDLASTAAPSVVTEDDGKSLKSFQSESYVHASQVAEPSQSSDAGAETQKPPKPRKSKAQLWNEMKISSISRAFTLIYTLALLTLLTRIQLNLLGRRTYLASVVSLATPPSKEPRIKLENHDDDSFEQAYGNDFETNRKYLSFSWWLLHRGCKAILEKVTTAVNEVFGPLNPREDISLQRLSELTLEVRKKVEGATEQERRNQKYLPYLLPSTEDEALVLTESGTGASSDSPLITPSLRRLLDETSDLIDSPHFTAVLTQLLDAAFSHLIDTKIAALAYKIPPTSASTGRIHELVNPNEVKAKVANTLAVFCRQAHAIGTGVQNEYLAQMEHVRDLEAFAAVVYASNWEAEVPESGSGSGSEGGSGAGAATATAAVRSEDVAGAVKRAWEETAGESAESGVTLASSTPSAPIPAPATAPAPALAPAAAPVLSASAGTTQPPDAQREEAKEPETEKGVEEGQKGTTEGGAGATSAAAAEPAPAPAPADAVPESPAIGVVGDAGDTGDVHVFESAWKEALAREDGKEAGPERTA